jgi:hypothetical protein
MRSYLSTQNSLSFFLILLGVFSSDQVMAQKPRIPSGGRVAVVVDERLSAVRAAPGLSARLEQRLSRGRYVAIVGSRRTADGLTFFDVKVSRRKHGWLQAGAVVSPSQAADDDRLLRLLRASEDFDLIARARIFLDMFPRSPLRPAVLQLYAEAAEAAASKLSRDAGRRLNHNEMAAGGAPEFSYFMNFNGLDRYNRQGIKFVFDSAGKRFHYEGAAWREIVRRYPKSDEAVAARKHLAALIAESGK